LLWRYDLGIYPAIPLIDGLLTCLAVAGTRLGLRGLHHWHRQGRSVMGGRRVLIVGAGEAGNLVVREMRGNPQLNMEPIAFADDDKAKIGTHIQGLPVLGSSTEIPEIVHQLQIQRIVVAIPSAPLGRLREITAVCQRTGIAIDVLPGIYELLAGTKTISPLPDVNIHRLLGREPVQTDQTEVAAALEGSTVLITGAGGSIGSELCRQVARFGPERIVLLGHGENSIFEIDLDLRLSHPQLVTHSVIADIREEDKIDRIVKRFRPSVIFHAAAHKHVPLMEANVAEATSNNVIGTRSVLRAAERNEIQRFVLISTDKAIRPTSIMGATKRLAELLVVAAAHRSGRAYMAVRFGNVLGSRGSVVPVFQRQIAAGGPVTITHPDMQRYFMTIPEAVQLVLQATVLGHGGEVFMLDMGHPVRILDLALDLIRLSGLEPGRDIEIAYTGVRPGEKLEEELLLEGEDYQRTKHKKIFMATTEDSINAEALERAIAELVELPRPMQLAAAMQRIHAVISEHQPAGTSYRTSPGYETSPPGPLKSWPYPSSA
jgi:FlaA1/EpsC-like NDP-sugar epimerase